MSIPQIMHPNGQTPYITIVDTGLATAAANLLAGLSLYHAEGDLKLDDWIERIELINNRLVDEIERRTF